jgi:hypothetical protein
MPNKVTFASFYPSATYLALVEHDATCPRDEKGNSDWDSPEHKAYMVGYKHHYGIAETACAEYLKALQASRALPSVPQDDMYRRTHRMAHSWNRLAQGKADDYDLDRLAHMFEYAHFVSGKTMRQHEHKTHEAAYASLVADVDSGSIPFYHADSREECQTTGEQLMFELHAWEPRLGVRPRGRIDPDARLEPAPRLAAPSVHHYVIDVPSGELLLADWFRIEAFTKAVADPAAEAYQYSINNAAGCHRKTSWFAEQHGFMSVFVGNSSPQVVVRSGQVVLASFDEDGELGEPEPEGEFLGRVCTDLWWATAIDRQKLTDIVAKQMPRAEAVAAIDELINEYSIHTVKVRPGKLHVYGPSDLNDLKRFESPAVKSNSIHHLYAVLSETELTWSPKRAAPAAPARRRARP